MIDAANVAAILLAAGRSARFGAADKLLAPLDGVPLAVHSAHRIAELSPGRTVAICRDASGPLAVELAAFGFEIIVNPHPEQGLSRSLALGIGVVADGPAAAALICLADMPFVGTAHLRALLQRFDPVDAPVIASSSGTAPMPPALFARSLFERLMRMEGDVGARALLAGAALVAASAGDLADIDRPDDLRPA